MTRLWMAVAAAALFVLWLVFVRITSVLVILAVIGGGLWAWWEIRELRKAMRNPPDS